MSDYNYHAPLYFSEKFISLEDATRILQEELHYPQERALHYVKKFDHNKDGRLSAEEFSNFKQKISET